MQPGRKAGSVAAASGIVPTNAGTSPTMFYQAERPAHLHGISPATVSRIVAQNQGRNEDIG